MVEASNNNFIGVEAFLRDLLFEVLIEKEKSWIYHEVSLPRYRQQIGGINHRIIKLKALNDRFSKDD